MNYDVIMMVIPENITLLKTAYPYLCNNLGADRIIFVANNLCKEIIEETFGHEKNVLFMDEEYIYDGMTYERIKTILNSLCGNSQRTGWFYQQFLKMAYSYKCKNDYYLVFDSDTIPLRKISYFDENENPRFIIKTEYHKPYFDTMKILFNGKVNRVDENVSFIAENMMIDKTIMIELIEAITGNDKLEGDSFYEKILNAIDRSVVYCTGFSEFETYGNYVMTYYPNKYSRIKLRTQRRGSFLLGTDPTPDQLEWAAKDYDIMSFEIYGNKWLGKKTKDIKTRNKNSAAGIFNKYIWISDLYDRLRGREVIKYDS